MSKGKAKILSNEVANNVEKLSAKRKEKIKHFQLIMGENPSQREKELFLSFSIAQILDENEENPKERGE